MDEIIRELIEFLKNASPVVWGALVKQVWVTAMNYGIWFIVSLGSSIGILYGYKKQEDKVRSTQERDYDDWEVEKFFVLVMAYLFAFVAIGFLISAINRFINPDYYAIMSIINQLKP